VSARYLVLGAGAVGAAIGARLFDQGHDVTLIARGDHLDRMRAEGLTLDAPGGTSHLRIPVVGHPAEARPASGDRVILAVKSQDTPAALDALASSADPHIAVLCAQNGVDNERQALRRFADVYAICVMLPATLLEPGVVQLHGTPRAGILDLGRYPDGVDATAVSTAADLEAAGFSSRPVERVMRLKYRKLLMNLANALEAACGSVDGGSLVVERARAEAVECFRAAGIDCASEEEDLGRRNGVLRVAPIEGRRRQGGSTWQSLARRTGSVEADALNGEIVLLGRLHGIPTPANELLRATANALAAARVPPGSVPPSELLDRLEQMTV
jgi:2-dehydropantoate 2-reductase